MIEPIDKLPVLSGYEPEEEILSNVMNRVEKLIDAVNALIDQNKGKVGQKGKGRSGSPEGAGKEKKS